MIGNELAGVAVVGVQMFKKRQSSEPVEPVAHSVDRVLADLPSGP